MVLSERSEPVKPRVGRLGTRRVKGIDTCDDGTELQSTGDTAKVDEMAALS